MYDNMKHLGLTLIQWRDEVLHGEWSLGEIYRMVQAGVDLKALSSSSDDYAQLKTEHLSRSSQSK